MKKIKLVGSEEIEIHEGLEKELSAYFEKTVHEDGSVSVEQICNSYFFDNDKWNINVIGEIKQFKETVENYNHTSQNIHFRLNNPLVNLEVKYVYYQQLFNDLWTIKSVLSQSPLRRVTEFLNEKYSKLSSLLDLDIEKAEREYLFWLNEKGIQTQTIKRNSLIEKDYVSKSDVAAFLRIIYTALFQYTDKREEWKKDRWDIRNLHDRYGIDYNKSINLYYIDFSKIPTTIREQVKKYFKQRLLSKNKFSWGTARNYMLFLTPFFTFVFTLEPTWKDLKALERKHIEKYIEYLNE